MEPTEFQLKARGKLLFIDFTFTLITAVFPTIATTQQSKAVLSLLNKKPQIARYLSLVNFLTVYCFVSLGCTGCCVVGKVLTWGYPLLWELDEEAERDTIRRTNSLRIERESRNNPYHNELELTNNRPKIPSKSLSEIRKTLNKKPYITKSQNESCAICLTTFKQNDDTVSLPCSESHTFHTDCLCGWLKE
jgi:hypothetical protein